MAYLNLNINSKYLGGNTDISIILPDRPFLADPAKFYKSKKKYKVLWLLHGTFGDHSDWIRKSMIELYACEKDLIVVMPSGLNTVYENWPEFGTGYNMWDYFFNELMPLIYGWFPASNKREDNYIAGLSMGGRGTMKFVCAHPELFNKAAVLSSAPRDLEKEIKTQTNPVFLERINNDIKRCGGFDNYLNSNENTWDHCKKLVNNKYPVDLYFACGEDDALYDNFLEFKKYARKIKLKAKFESIPGYQHEWRFWDIGIQKALQFFDL